MGEGVKELGVRGQWISVQALANPQFCLDALTEIHLLCYLLRLAHGHPWAMSVETRQFRESNDHKC